MRLLNMARCVKTLKLRWVNNEALTALSVVVANDAMSPKACSLINDGLAGDIAKKETIFQKHSMT
jgi:hypothetical protein